MEVYRTVKSGDPVAIEREMARLHRFKEFMMRGPFVEEFGMGGKEAHMFCMEFPRMLERMLRHSLDEKEPTPHRRKIRNPLKQ